MKLTTTLETENRCYGMLWFPAHMVSIITKCTPNGLQALWVVPAPHSQVFPTELTKNKGGHEGVMEQPSDLPEHWFKYLKKTLESE